MQQLSHVHCEQVGGGSPLALLSFALATVVAAGALREFADGVFDGFGGL